MCCLVKQMSDCTEWVFTYSTVTFLKGFLAHLIFLGVYAMCMVVISTKLDDQFMNCTSLGFSISLNGYICYSPTLHEHFTSRQVTLCVQIITSQRIVDTEGRPCTGAGHYSMAVSFDAPIGHIVL